MRRPLVIFAALAVLMMVPVPALAAPPGLDAGFGVDGVTKIDFFGKQDTARGMATAPDGKIVVVGSATPSGSTIRDFAIVRLNPDGTLDETFGSGGKRTIDFKPTGSESWKDDAKDVVVQPDGDIVVAGVSLEPTTDSTIMTITRLNAADGSTDITFGDPLTPGVIHIVLGPNGTEANAIARFANGKFVVAGAVYGTTNRDMAWAGLNQVGQEDPISGSQGFTTGSMDYGFDVAVTPGGGFVVAGVTDAASYDIAVTRRTINGNGSQSQDNTFNGNGRTTVGYGGAEEASAVAVQPDNKVLTAGYKSAPGGSDFLVHRLTATGLPDTSFGNPANNGGAFIDFGSSDGAGELQLLPGGKIAVVGSTGQGSTNSPSDVAVARLTGSGALDSSFGVGGKRTIVLPGNQGASGLAVQPDGGLLVAGSSRVVALASSDFFVMRVGKFTPRPVRPGPPGAPAAPGLAKVAISVRSLRASAKGVVAVKLRCSAAAACGGTVDLTTARKVSVSAKKRKLKLGRKSYSVAAGKSKTVKLKLRRSGLKLLRKRRKLRVRLTVTTRRAGAKAAKVGRTVTLSAARKKKGKR
jgi:uncharacterized delta-60 repeat protein